MLDQDSNSAPIRDTLTTGESAAQEPVGHGGN